MDLAGRTESAASRWIDLFLISVLGLFFEVMLIRWESAELRQFAYFKNFTFISVFVGLGVGFALKDRRDRSSWVGPLLAGLLLAIALGAPALRQAHANAPLTAALGGAAFRNVHLVAVLLAGFLLNLAVFVPIGQWTGRAMHGLPVLPAYSVNVAGSLAGIAGFVVLAWARTPPAVWFAAGTAPLLILLRARPRALLAAVVAMGGALVAVAHRVEPGATEVVWSPYQKLVLSAAMVPGSWNLQISTDWYQHATDLSPKEVARFHELAVPAAQYLHPFLQKPRAERVLILGAGMGNDVAAALRAGAKRIDAVDIDPGILDLGRRYHPEHPYADPRVRAIASDARAFIERSREAYDVIVFTVIDSQTLLESMSSVRLDNYVYTVECLRRAAKLLAPGGILEMSFAIGQPWVSQRVHDLFYAAFGHEPVSLTLGGTVYFIEGAARPDIAQALGLSPIAFPPPTAAVPTDEWPYLYLRQRGIPPLYLAGIGLGLLVCLAVVLAGFKAGAAFDVPAFFLGAGFFLVETKGLTELALLFGSTWTVNAIGFAIVLVLILGANALAATRRAPRQGVSYGLLFAAIAAGYAASFVSLSGASLPARAAAAVLLFLPIFFAGLVFAHRIKGARDLSPALASNLVGAVLGGFAEYWSMVGGTRSLYLIAAAFYAGSWISAKEKKGASLS